MPISAYKVLAGIQQCGKFLQGFLPGLCLMVLLYRGGQFFMVP